MELRAYIMWDDWGRRGFEGLAGRLCYENSNRKVELLKNKPYSSFSLGTHSLAYCTLKYTKQSLKNYITENTEVLGKAKERYFKDELPFIVKVISLRCPRSLKMQPDQEQCKMLRKMSPKRYLDVAAKQVFLISVGFGELLLGVKPRDEIRYFLKTVPELSIMIPSTIAVDYIQADNKSVKELLYYLYNSSIESRTLAIETLLCRMEKLGPKLDSFAEYHLVKKIHSHLPYYPGVFSPFFFNHLITRPGEGIFIRPKLVYALLLGDYIVCTTNSNNTIRLALTLKYRDIEAFLITADLNHYSIDEFRVNGKFIETCIMRYSTPAPEIIVDRIALPKGLEYELPVHESPSILIMVRGHIRTSNYRELYLGSMLFLSANEEFRFKVRQDTIIYQFFSDISE